MMTQPTATAPHATGGADAYPRLVARYVIDALTLLHVIDSDLSVGPSHQLVAPNSIRSQALQVLLRDVRAGDRTDAAALRTHERLKELKMRLLGDRVSRNLAWRIAREHDWATLAEAEYLAIARLQADALITVDARLAAMAQGIVPVAQLAALAAESGT